MNLALDKLHGMICHKTETNKQSKLFHELFSGVD